MSTFRIGQRVKLTRLSPNGDGSVPIGACGSIKPMHRDCYKDHTVQFDGFLYLSQVDGWQLEPLYDGNVKVEWSECVWQPTGVSA